MSFVVGRGRVVGQSSLMCRPDASEIQSFEGVKGDRQTRRQPRFLMTEIEREVEFKRGGGGNRITGVFVTVNLKMPPWTLFLSVFSAKWLSLLPVIPVYKVASWWRCAECVRVRHLVFLSENWAPCMYAVCVYVFVCMALLIDHVLISCATERSNIDFRYKLSFSFSVSDWGFLSSTLWWRVHFSKPVGLGGPVCRLHMFTSWNRRHNIVLWLYEVTHLKLLI